MMRVTWRAYEKMITCLSNRDKVITQLEHEIDLLESSNSLLKARLKEWTDHYIRDVDGNGVEYIIRRDSNG